MNRVLIAVLLVLLAVLGVLVFQLLPEEDLSGWSTTEQGTCYLYPHGEAVSGWYTIEGRTYYFHPESRTLHTGWVEEKGSRYYTLEGLPLTGWEEVDGAVRYFRPDGTLASGWLEENGARYYLTEDGTTVSGWVETDKGQCYFNEEGILCTGVVATAEGTFCFREDGSRHRGWLEQDGKHYYAREDGSLFTGWLEENGNRYYLKEDGSAATGRMELEGTVYHFTSFGMEFTLVNRWNPLPDNYAPDYVTAEGHAVDPACRDALLQMLSDCRAAGNTVHIMSAYRSYRDQNFNYNNAIWARVRKGIPYEQAKVIAAMNVALPGTSEHQLGLAVDLVDSSCPELEEIQESLPAQQWLMEHCWDYGFILRYPEGTTDWTGIVYEPWHYRYVGVELAKEMQELGICLEEYIDMLTNDGTTGGQPEA